VNCDNGARIKFTVAAKASILKAGRVVFNIKGNDYRWIVRVQYQASVFRAVMRSLQTKSSSSDVDDSRTGIARAVHGNTYRFEDVSLTSVYTTKAAVKQTSRYAQM